MWNNSLEGLTHEYSKKGIGILELQKGILL